MLMSDIYDIPFSPPYGDGTSHTSDSCWPSTVFAPLRGWYPKYITEYRKMEEPDG